MKTSTKFFIGAIAIGVVGVGTYLYIQIQKLINAPFKVTGARNVDVSGGEIKLTLLTQITNESDISAYVKDQFYEFFVNDKLVSKIENKSEIFVGAAHKHDKQGNLKPNDATIPLKVDINKDALLKVGTENLLNLIADRTKIKFKIKGYFTWKAGLISAKQPFEYLFTLQEVIDMNKKP